MHRASFSYEEGDIVAANLADYRWRASRPRARIAQGAAIVLTMTLFALVMHGLGEERTAIAVTLVSGLAGGIAALFAVHAINRWWLRRYARRNFAEQVSLRDPFTFDWDAERLESRSARGSNNLRWDELVRWRETDAIVMLYLADRLYLALPTRAFDAEQLASIRAAVAAAMPGGERAST